MSPTRHLPDGTVLSGAQSSLRGAPSREQCSSLERGIVVAYRASDVSAIAVPVVDVLLVRRGSLCTDVPVNNHGAGDNGAAWTPSPCSDFDLSRWDSYDPATLDGDRVVVGFIDDDPALPFVVCPLPSRKAAAGWLPKEAEGCVRTLRHQGTTVTLDDRGNITVDTTRAPLANGRQIGGSDPAGRVTLNLGSSTQLEVTVGGERRLLINDGKVSVVADLVELGAEAAAFAAVLGERLLAWLNRHTHPTGVGPSSPPLEPAAADLLSTVVKVQE